jgi:hypothetical protein
MNRGTEKLKLRRGARLTGNTTRQFPAANTHARHPIRVHSCNSCKTPAPLPSPFPQVPPYSTPCHQGYPSSSFPLARRPRPPSRRSPTEADRPRPSPHTSLVTHHNPLPLNAHRTRGRPIVQGDPLDLGPWTLDPSRNTRQYPPKLTRIFTVRATRPTTLNPQPSSTELK